MVARKRTKKAETPAAETIIEASDSPVADGAAGIVASVAASVAANIRGAYLPVWLCAALCLSAVALGLAGWPYLHKVLNPQPSTPWAADIAAAQAGFDSQIGALETRIATLDSQFAQFAENSETASADRTEQAARLAQIASQLDALDTQLAALRQPPPASKQPSADRAARTSPPSSDERTDQPTQPPETDMPETSFLSKVGGFFSQIPERVTGWMSGLGDMFSSVITITPLSPDDEKEAGS